MKMKDLRDHHALPYSLGQGWVGICATCGWVGDLLGSRDDAAAEGRCHVELAATEDPTTGLRPDDRGPRLLRPPVVRGSSSTATDTSTRSRPAVGGTSTFLRLPLTAICNEAANLHRRHYGRGPGAVKTYVSEPLVVVVLSNPFTPLERTLIDGGRDDVVRTVRAALRDTVEATYMERMAATIGRPISRFDGSVTVAPDTAVDVFLLAPAPGDREARR